MVVDLLTGGVKYVGEFREGLFHGRGALSLRNGDLYVGEFVGGLQSGDGILYSPEGAVLKQGRWSFGGFSRTQDVDQDRLPFSLRVLWGLMDREETHLVLPPCPSLSGVRWHNCVGAYTESTGRRYVGEWVDNNRNGMGTFFGAGGEQYVGEIKDNLPHGIGIQYAPNGAILQQGNWLRGSFTSPHAVDTSRFPFIPAGGNAQPADAQAFDAGRPERDRLATEVELERRRRQELEYRLAATQINGRVSDPTAVTLRAAHALVIGNAAYPGSGRLENPVNDAIAISQKLRSMGFTVTTVTDANRLRLVQALAQFRRSAASADMSVLFYSGHGVQIFGANYILPTDVDQNDTAQATIQGVRLNEVIENFMPGRTKIVFLDACRDNPLQRTGDRSVTKGLAPISVAEGTLISYATKDGQVAADGIGSKNSPFTQALLEHLADPQDISVVLRRVREKVMRATGGKQQPWDYGSLTGGELILSAVKAR